jgi:hypothetical protein
MSKEGTTQMQNGGKTFTLPSGKVAVIKEGKGLHARNAIKMCDGDMSLYLSALMSQLITVDGKELVMEDLDEMPMQDYMKLQSEFADQNFTLPQGT